MKAITLTLTLAFNCILVSGQELETKYHKAVSDFIVSVKKQNKEKLADQIVYPLWRKYPLPDIKDKQDLLKRYHEVFDQQLIEAIGNSNPKTDWAALGWRGITLQLPSGSVWLDYDGKLHALNYQSLAETKRRDLLIKTEKITLHRLVKTFKEPVLVLRTAKYKVRIDDMGNQNYRYASWPLNSSMSEKPELVITNGHWIPEGSGSNCRYDFQNGDYRYECAIMNSTRKETCYLKVYKRDQEILATTGHQQIPL